MSLHQHTHSLTPVSFTANTAAVARTVARARADRGRAGAVPVARGRYAYGEWGIYNFYVFYRRIPI